MGLNMEEKKIISEDEARQLWGEIENQGFGYWVLEYGYEGEDPKLIELNNNAKKTMKELKAHLQDIWDHYEIG